VRLSRRFTGPLAAGMMAAGAAVAAAAPATASTVTPYWHIMTIPQGYDHPLCLEARNGAVNGGAVDLWPCESSESNERWHWPPSATPGGSPFPGPKPIQTRVSGSTGFCLDVPGAQTTPGLQLQTWRCNGTLAQRFWVAQ
jgi:hypothetical protein